MEKYCSAASVPPKPMKWGFFFGEMTHFRKNCSFVHGSKLSRSRTRAWRVQDETKTKTLCPKTKTLKLSLETSGARMTLGGWRLSGAYLPSISVINQHVKHTLNRLRAIFQDCRDYLVTRPKGQKRTSHVEVGVFTGRAPPLTPNQPCQST